MVGAGGEQVQENCCEKLKQKLRRTVDQTSRAASPGSGVT